MARQQPAPLLEIAAYRVSNGSWKVVEDYFILGLKCPSECVLGLEYLIELVFYVVTQLGYMRSEHWLPPGSEREESGRGSSEKT
ncbi:MAG: hypothetical protein ACREXX_03010 [Gammaproteobacteria bacterium]